MEANATTLMEIWKNNMPVKDERNCGSAIKGYRTDGVKQIGDVAVFVVNNPHASIAQIAGDSNNWQPQQSPMEKIDKNGFWQAELMLPAGRHRYRLVIDGQWQQYPYNEEAELNPYGKFNSVIIIS